MPKNDVMDQIEEFIEERPASREFVSVPQQETVKPAFRVRKLDGTYKKEVHYFDKEQNRILRKEVELPKGYLVIFSKGHSVHAVDEEHLKRLRADLQMIPLVDTDTGEVRGSVPNKIAA